MKDTASGRPQQLEDRAWLARRHAQDGDTVIAVELGVSRGTVIRARERLGIPSQPVGRRRGRALAVVIAPSREPTGSLTLTGSLGMFAERFQRESRVSGPAGTLELVAARIKAVAEAEHAADQLAFEDALLSAASGLLLVHQHQRRLRRAA